MVPPKRWIKQLLPTFGKKNANGPPDVFDKTASPHLLPRIMLMVLPTCLIKQILLTFCQKMQMALPTFFG